MQSDFARTCLTLTGSLLHEAFVGGTSEPSPQDSLTLAVSRNYVSRIHSLLSEKIETYDPRAELRRISCDTKDVCVVVTNPRVQFSKDNDKPDGLVSLLCSYVWQRTDDGPQLVHIHISTLGLAIDPPSANGTLRMQTPKHIALNSPSPTSPRGTSKIRTNGADKKDNAAPKKRLTHVNMLLKSTDGRAHFFDASQIVSIKSEGNYVRVRGTDRELRVRSSLAALMERMPDYIIRVHRSYAINALRVRIMHDNQMKLSNDDIIHIPDRRRTAIREQVRRIQEAYTDPDANENGAN